MSAWTFGDIPDQSGRTALVTGANTGIGFETARMLAARGAAVTLACRSRDKGEAGAERIRLAHPSADVGIGTLDLADLDAVAAFATHVASSHDRLDLLIDNAGVMIPPLGRTRQGHELQFGTNHLGHFALTGRLLPLLESTPGARVVVVASAAQNIGRIDFDDLDWRRRPYQPWLAYGQSKLANMLFALELQRRLAAAGSSLCVTASHPGWTSTELTRTAGFFSFLGPLLGMSPRDGALTSLRAATDPAAAGGSYWGPTGLTGMSGSPGLVVPSAAARDEVVAGRLFDESERITGVTYFDPVIPAKAGIRSSPLRNTRSRPSPG